MVAPAKFIDVDFTKCEQYSRGYDPKPRQDYGVCRGAFADSFELVPESQWREAADAQKKAGGGISRLVTRIYNQSNEGSCVGNAGCQGLEVLQARTVGKQNVVPISAMSLYKQIGSSPGSGAMVEDGVDRLYDTGVLPLDTPANKARFKHTMSHTNFRQPWPNGWKETAALFKGVEGYICRSVNEMISALLRGMPVWVGRAGHSILYLEVVFEPELFVDYVNSWGQWGFGKGDFEFGFGRDSRRYYADSADWCYALEAPEPSKWTWINDPNLSLAL